MKYNYTLIIINPIYDNKYNKYNINDKYNINIVRSLSYIITY